MVSDRGDVNERLAALGRAAELHEHAGRLEEALHAYEHMLALNAKYQHGAYRVDILDRIASVLTRLGRSDEAARYRAEADSRQAYDDYLRGD